MTRVLARPAARSAEGANRVPVSREIVIMYVLIWQHYPPASVQNLLSIIFYKLFCPELLLRRLHASKV
jgi:hypothetical protein